VSWIQVRRNVPDSAVLTNGAKLWQMRHTQRKKAMLARIMTVLMAATLAGALMATQVEARGGGGGGGGGGGKLELTSCLKSS
jgi:hypothetical protein